MLKQEIIDKFFEKTRNSLNHKSCKLSDDWVIDEYGNLLHFEITDIYKHFIPSSWKKFNEFLKDFFYMKKEFENIDEAIQSLDWSFVDKI